MENTVMATVAAESITRRSFNLSNTPYVYESRNANENLIEFFDNNTALINQDLNQHGALLFRGFNIKNIQDFDKFTSYRLQENVTYVGGATPRKKLSKLTSTSTIFPKDQSIRLHNELSYEITMPAELLFCCIIAPSEQGQTPIVDTHKVYNDIDPLIIEEFRQRNGWKLTRNYGQCFGPSVKDGFGTTDSEQIMSDCTLRDITCEILDTDKIRTTQIRPAVHEHPNKSGLPLWINHIAFWHSSSLSKEYFEHMSSSLAPEEFPYLVQFGDGTNIPDSYVDHIHKAYQKNEIIFDWQKGDILLLDNYQIAHGRKPYEGNRLIAVSMGY